VPRAGYSDTAGSQPDSEIRRFTSAQRFSFGGGSQLFLGINNTST